MKFDVLRVKSALSVSVRAESNEAFKDAASIVL
jgi:hypothetical protein